MAFRVLLVEDHVSSRMMYALGLTLDGFIVSEVESAEAALAALRHQPPDVIVTDVCMPGMDGLELCRQIRTMEGDKRIPLVVMTGHPASPEFRDACAAGACAACCKPVTPDALGRIVQTLLAERSKCLGCCETDKRFVPVDFGSGVRAWMRHEPD